MSNNSPNRELARGEARSMTHWGAEAQEVIDLLSEKYGITGAEADAMIAEAVKIRKSHVRKKAAIGLAFAVVGLVIPIAYFSVQKSVGFIVIGFGPILMGLLGLASLAMACRSMIRIFTGHGPV